jgi:hypothetical protein
MSVLIGSSIAPRGELTENPTSQAIPLDAVVGYYGRANKRGKLLSDSDAEGGPVRRAADLPDEERHFFLDKVGALKHD